MTETNHPSNKKETGLIHIYTGTGKGKTTAAIGLAARALGSGLSVCYCSFHKCPDKYGYTEMESLKQLGAQVINFAQYHPHMDKNVTDDTLATIKHEVNEAIDTLSSLLYLKEIDVLIMDEIFISVRDNYLDEQRLIDFITNKPANTELVLTGRGATEKTMAMADYITNMECVKHPYYQDILSRKGIEY